MPQLLVRPESIANNSFALDGAEAHHLIRVLRAKVGDKISLFDGEGRRFQAEVSSIEPNAVRGKILLEEAAQPKKTRLHLFQGIPKGAKMEYVIEKSVELGADAIVPFLSEKSVIKLSAPQSEAKQQRWQKIAIAAAKQCNRADVPPVNNPKALCDLGSELGQGVTLFLWEKEKNATLKQVLSQVAENTSLINIVIGPESGFSSTEAEWIKAQGATAVTVGNRILRTETAGLVALSILNYQLGLF